MLTSMTQTIDPKTDEELSALYNAMRQFTYVFCQKETYVEPYNVGAYKKISYRYNIIGLIDTESQNSARKMIYERIIMKNKINYSDSAFRLVKIQDKHYDKDKAREFFSYLQTFGFDQLDNECLTNTKFPDPNHPNQMRIEQLSDTQSEFNFLYSYGKIRRVDCYLPEYIFSKHPQESLCRAIYIICRNKFTDRIWKQDR